jgi:hypothetical protein
MSDTYTPVYLSTYGEPKEQAVIVGCVICCALVTRSDLADHYTWHRSLPRK